MRRTPLQSGPLQLSSHASFARKPRASLALQLPLPPHCVKQTQRDEQRCTRSEFGLNGDWKKLHTLGSVEKPEKLLVVPQPATREMR